jgi:hypothetical protein
METLMAAKKKPQNIEKTPETLTNVEALKITIQELRNAGKLADIDAARVAIAFGLARAADIMPDNPTVWREYRAAEKSLREETEAHGDPFDQLLRELSAPMGDETKQEKKNTRP